MTHDFDDDAFANLDGFSEDYPDSQSLFLVELDDAVQEALAGSKWESRVITLNEDSPWEERIALYQAFREEAVFPSEACYFLIVWAIESMAQVRIDDLYNSKYSVRVDKIRQQHGMAEDEEWEPGEGPKEFQELETEFSQAVEGILRATYQFVGEHKIAELIEKDPAEAQRIYNTGNDYFEELFEKQA